MANQVSSADFRKLYAYARWEDGTAAETHAEAARLESALDRFSGRCTESAFRVRVDVPRHLPSWMNSHANEMTGLAAFARGTGTKFETADTGGLIGSSGKIVIESPYPDWLDRIIDKICDWLRDALWGSDGDQPLSGLFVKPVYAAENENWSATDHPVADNEIRIPSPYPAWLNKIIDGLGKWLRKILFPDSADAGIGANQAMGAGLGLTATSMAVVSLPILSALTGSKRPKEMAFFEPVYAAEKVQPANAGESLTNRQWTALGQLAATAAPTESQWRRLYERQLELAAEMASLGDDLMDAEKRKEDLAKRLKELRAWIAQLEAARDDAQDARRNLINLIMGLRGTYGDIVEDYDAILAQLKAEEAQLAGELAAIEDMETRFREMEAERKRIEAQLAAGLDVEGPAENNSGFSPGQCTRYVADRRLVDWTGNANQWDEHARKAGYEIGAIPIVGAIAVWEPGKLSSDPSYGHVAYVDKVTYLGGGKYRVDVSEQNWPTGSGTRTRTIEITVGSDGLVHDPIKPDGKALSFIYGKAA